MSEHDAPERVWINGQGQWWHEVEKSRSDIPYRREREPCKWRRWAEGDISPSLAYKTGCGTAFLVDGSVPGQDDYLHCPYCACTIRIVEGET